MSRAVVTADAQAITTPLESPWQRFRRRFLAQRAPVVALVFLLAMALVAILAPWIATHDPNSTSLRSAFAGVGWNHFLGADDIGRDMFSRLVFATRVSLQAAFQAVALAMAIGVPLGLISGYVGGWLDVLIMRLVDAMMVFPSLILAIAIVGFLGPSLTNAMIAIGITYAPYFARIVRGATLAVREETYIQASQQIGASTLRILRRHVLPNILSPLVVQATLSLGLAILSEAALSFLGMGVQPPNASWGGMLRRSFSFIDQSAFNVVTPGIMIMLVVLAFNVLGDGLRDAIGRETRTGK